MSHILVTGGAGYVGSHTCKALARAGFVPVTLDNLSAGHRDFVRWGPLEIGDAGDRAFVSRVCERYQPIAAMHFAGSIQVGESVREPGRYYSNNVSVSLRLLETLRRHAVNHFVFSSTCAIYGTPDTQPIPEDCPVAPASPYGRTKWMVEEILRDLVRAHGLHAALLRYFNASGADPDGAIGEDHHPETHLIPRLLLAALGALERLDLLGTDYPTPDGTCIRDYIHVSDLADGHVLALQHLLRQGGLLELNLGTGKGTSVREVISVAERVIGHAVPLRELPRRPGDVPVLVADARRARELLGFHPVRSDIESIIGSAWAWHRGRHAARGAPPLSASRAEQTGTSPDREKNSMRLSVVIPCFNEEEVIEMTHRALIENLGSVQGVDLEIVYVDDGSRDRTPLLLRGIADQDGRVRVVIFSRNFGHQAAITAGLRHAGGEAVAIMDADLQDPPGEVLNMLAKWRDGAEIVYAVRRRRRDPLLKRIIASMYYRVYRRIADFDVPLDAGDFCLLDRKVVDTLNALPERNRYARGLRAWVGFRHVGHEFDRQERAAGSPKYSFSKSFRLGMDGIINFTSAPLRSIFGLGVAVTALSLFVTMALILQRILGFTPFGIDLAEFTRAASVLIAVMFMGGVQMISIGIMGEYVARIYDEVKQRPMYIVRDVYSRDARDPES